MDYNVDQYILGEDSEIYIVSELSRVGCSIIKLKGGTVLLLTDLRYDKYHRYWLQIGDTIVSEITGKRLTLICIYWDDIGRYEMLLKDSEGREETISEHIAKNYYNLE